MIPIKDQVNFFDWQLKELALQWENYINTPMQVLFDVGKAFRGELHAVDHNRGNVIFKFSKFNAPRIEQSYSLYLYKFADKTEYLSNWEIKFKEFRTSGFCHYRENSDPLPIYYLDNEDIQHRYIGCANIDIDAFNKFDQDLLQGKKTLVVFGEKEPPYQFLINLKQVVSNGQEPQKSELDLLLDSYQTIPFNEFDKVALIEKELQLRDLLVIQGPPGTGKSTLVSKFVAAEVKRGKSICITALSNKALMEIALKDAIKCLPSGCQVFKTGLTKTEQKELPLLKSATEITAFSEAVLLTTYYKLSQAALSGVKLFDLLIIEEASQAFYPVLKAFAKLAEKTLIIGDPNQLTPIVLNEGQANTIHPKIAHFVNGLDSLMRIASTKSFILNESYRLSPYNARLTGGFYHNLLIGMNQPPKSLTINSDYQRYFDPQSPHKLMLAANLMDDDDLKQISVFIKRLTANIEACNQGLKIAILTPYKKDVLLLQQEVLGVLTSGRNKIIIETIDKVQGLTVDINILVIRMDGNLKFVFNKNRFNVATSRASGYNLLITDRKVKLLKNNIPIEVSAFIDKLDVVQ